MSPSQPDSPNKLSTGATVGIIVAAVCLCFLLIGAGVGWFLWRKKNRREPKTDSGGTTEKAEFEDTSPQNPTELHGDATTPGEVEGDGSFYGPIKKHGWEMEGSPAPSDRAEAPGTHGGLEMEGSRGGVEMDGNGLPEMDGGRREVFELPAENYLTADKRIERRGRRSPGKSRTPLNPQSPTSSLSTASAQSPPSDTTNIGSQRDWERRHERDRRRETGRASDDTRRWSWRRSRMDGEPF